MKLKAELNGHEFELTFELSGEHAVADVNGRKYQLDVHEVNNGGFVIFQRRRVFECRVNPQHGSRDVFAVTIRGNTYAVTIVDPRRLQTDLGSDRHHHGIAEIVAPMPGKVVRVLVEKGQQVEAGTGLVVVEAMKMQNEMKSPRAGVVASMNVEAGATVEAGTVLAVIE